MTQPTARRRHCPHCDGFPTVHITTGTRHLNHTRETIPVTCPTCQGTGTVPVGVRAAVGSRA
ncbi:hypothetical protein [Streptomyces sparsus]